MSSDSLAADADDRWRSPGLSAASLNASVHVRLVIS